MTMTNAQYRIGVIIQNITTNAIPVFISDHHCVRTHA